MEAAKRFAEDLIDTPKPITYTYGDDRVVDLLLLITACAVVLLAFMLGILVTRLFLPVKASTARTASSPTEMVNRPQSPRSSTPEAYEDALEDAFEEIAF